jgi:hypothetical protein
MDVLMRVLHKEERKLLAVQEKIASRLTSLRAAIHALAGNGNVKARGSKLRGRKLSAAHRKAIKLGWAKRKAAGKA